MAEANFYFALEAAVAGGSLKSMPFLMCQPIAYKTPEGSGGLDLKQGFIDLPEFPFALEPRVFFNPSPHSRFLRSEPRLHHLGTGFGK